MKKYQIQIVKLGNQRHGYVFDKLVKYKSKLFDVTICEKTERLSDSNWHSKRHQKVGRGVSPRPNRAFVFADSAKGLFHMPCVFVWAQKDSVPHLAF
jgi:hypothetical protein